MNYPQFADTAFILEICSKLIGEHPCQLLYVQNMSEIVFLLIFLKSF